MNLIPSETERPLVARAKALVETRDDFDIGGQDPGMNRALLLFERRGSEWRLVELRLWCAD